MAKMLRKLLFLVVWALVLAQGLDSSRSPSTTRRPRPYRPALGLLRRAMNKTGEHPDFSYRNILDAAIVLIRAAKRIGPSVESQAGMMTDLEELDRIDENADEDMEEKTGNPKCPPKPIDCEELLVSCDFVTSGVYRIYPRSRLDTWGDGGFEVFCDMETDGGGWTLIQKRDDYGETPDFFFKDWESYKVGFGDLNYDYWLGNDKIFALSNQRKAALRFDLSDFEGGSGFATYDDFYIDDESQGYRLHIGDFRGDIGDSFTAHNNCRFTTKDKDNDRHVYFNCALLYKGGWWYNDCHTVNLHGLYLKGPHQSYGDGINWYLYKGFHYSLKRTEMKIRSKDFVREINLDVALQDSFEFKDLLLF